MLLTEEAVGEARGAHLTPRGHLRLHCPHGLGLLLMPLVAGYNALCPEVVIELTLSQRNPDPLAEGHDVVITVDGALPDSQLIAVPLGNIFSIPAAPSYLNPWCPSAPRTCTRIAACAWLTRCMKATGYSRRVWTSA
jgi:DNA-binding transcriptional LysR family regulator